MNVRRRLSALVLGTLVASTLAAGGAASAERPARQPTGRTAKVEPAHLALPWGVYTSGKDEAYNAYTAASGDDKKLLGKIALRPRVRWFGTWIPTQDVDDKIAAYIAVVQHGNTDSLVQLATFRLWPNGGEAAKNKALTNDDQLAYRAWVRSAAAGIGDARVALVLEPDLGVALGGWRPEVRLALTRYAAQVFSKLPRTSVYLDASDADWLSVDRSVSMLRAAGIGYARGFALGATHYYATSSNRTYAHNIIAALDKAGITGKHAVIDTADNGKAFTWKQYWTEHPHGDFDNAETCSSRTDTTCVTLGHPPTPSTADDAIDGFLWFGRAWLYRQASPFKLDRALAMARTTPY